MPEQTTMSRILGCFDRWQVGSALHSRPQAAASFTPIILLDCNAERIADALTNGLSERLCFPSTMAW